MTPAWEAALAEALRQENPAAALRRAARSLPARLAAMFRNAQPDGVAIAALLAARLRAERLLRASADARRWHDEDVEDFARAFRRYHAEVPPTAFSPAAEAALFRSWCAERSRVRPRRRRS